MIDRAEAAPWPHREGSLPSLVGVSPPAAGQRQAPPAPANQRRRGLRLAREGHRAEVLPKPCRGGPVDRGLDGGLQGCCGGLDGRWLADGAELMRWHLFGPEDPAVSRATEGYRGAIATGFGVNGAPGRAESGLSRDCALGFGSSSDECYGRSQSWRGGRC